MLSSSPAFVVPEPGDGKEKCENARRKMNLVELLIIQGFALPNNLRCFVENISFCRARTSANIKVHKIQ